jgi:hypothetical protein
MRLVTFYLVRGLVAALIRRLLFDRLCSLLRLDLDLQRYRGMGA